MAGRGARGWGLRDRKKPQLLLQELVYVVWRVLLVKVSNRRVCSKSSVVAVPSTLIVSVVRPTCIYA